MIQFPIRECVLTDSDYTLSKYLLSNGNFCPEFNTHIDPLIRTRVLGLAWLNGLEVSLKLDFYHPHKTVREIPLYHGLDVAIESMKVFVNHRHPFYETILKK